MVYLKKARPDIIFLMLDTVRADSLRAFGGNQRLPTLDAISSKGAIYTRAVAPGTFTVPSHASLFLNKRVKGIKSLKAQKNKRFENKVNPFLAKVKYIEKSDVTLAKKLAYLGYRTALVSNNPLVSSHIGMAEGFEQSYDLWLDKVGLHRLSLSIASNARLREAIVALSYAISRFMPAWFLDRLYLRLRTKTNIKYFNESGSANMDSGARRTNSVIRRHLERSGEGNNFIFVNYMEGHEGYPSNLFTGDYVEQDRWLYLSKIKESSGVALLRQAYDKRVRYLDSQLSRLMRTLKQTGALDNSVVVISSDHGQAFMEHGQMYHGVFPYKELTHVPLIAARFKDGRQVNTREEVRNFVSLTAIHDSILDIAYGKTEEINGGLRRDSFIFSDHIGITELWDAHLLRLLSPRSKYANAIYNTKLKYDKPATATYYKNMKLISYADGRNEMYNLDNDENETENVIASHRPEAMEMLRAERQMR